MITIRDVSCVFCKTRASLPMGTAVSRPHYNYSALMSLIGGFIIIILFVLVFSSHLIAKIDDLRSVLVHTCGNNITNLKKKYYLQPVTIRYFLKVKLIEDLSLNK